MSGLAVVILAAGQGTRMLSQQPKVLHALAGIPLLAHVVRAAMGLRPERLVVVVGFGAGAIQEAIGKVLPNAGITWVTQEERLGTAHAVGCALPALSGFHGDVLILNGDHPLIRTPILEAFVAAHRDEGWAVTLLSTTPATAAGYGRVVRRAGGRLERVVEEKDATPAERDLVEVSTGTYCLAADRLPGWIARVGNANAQGEYYLPDVVALAVADGVGAGAFHHPEAASLVGVNNRRHLAQLEGLLRDRLVGEWMDRGVTFVDPSSCWVAADVELGADTVIFPHVILGPGVVVGRDCEIGPFCQVVRSRLAERVRVLSFCHLEGAEIAADCVVGPYSRLRPGTELASKARIGNFCETKKARIGVGSKVNHLSYIGDAEVGAGVNIGAGTITCNYDGVLKHKTVLGDGVFVGSDTHFVAPITVGDRAVVGAGTTVTEDIPADALAVARAPQRNIPNWTARRPKRSK
ncbi:MAG: bifunctional UDP-N-acetylglucosamine diphosphorylase/glucosamine-1-phosphate N-acetyltransferase GlmU [Magnetococcales bacterium]|nr:bifunctional UDP-N-acetylglucosamine diphosphorylase/glucosamine-1-phosphate N-acetyltransferase GlmU [Magnetococcales bacterium]